MSRTTRVPRYKLIQYTRSLKCRVYSAYKSRAKIRHIPFEITKEELFSVISQNCAFCNKPPTNTRRHEYYDFTYNYNGLDRIDNSQGYLKSNVQPCCAKCNSMKSNLKQNDFLKHLKKIVRFCKLKRLR